MSRNQTYLDGIEARFRDKIIPKFTENVPKRIQKELEKDQARERGQKFVSIRMMLMILFGATITGTSIQATRDHLAEVQAMQNMFDPSAELSDEVYETNIREFKQKIPKAQYIRNSLKLWKPENIQSRCRQINKEFIREMKNSRLIELIHGRWGNNGLSAAFDITEVKYYGKDRKEDPYTVSSKDKKGSKYCHAYLTLQIMCPGFRLTIDVEPVFDSNPDWGRLMVNMLKRAKRAHLKINNLYVDRGFYRAEVLQTFNDELSRRLILPAKRTETVKKAIRKWYKQHGYEAGHLKVKIKGGSGHQQDYILIFKPKSEEERKKWRIKEKLEEDDLSIEHVDKDFVYFCVNELPKDGDNMAQIFEKVAREYRNRWGIETGYRVSKQVWAWTTSTNYHLRFWLMWFSVIVYNIWVLENLKQLDLDTFEPKRGKRKTPEEIQSEIRESYNCCNFPTMEEVEADRERRKRAKLPADQRSTKHFPSRPWQPRPKIKMRELTNRILLVIIREINRLDQGGKPTEVGYDPPET